MTTKCTFPECSCASHGFGPCPPEWRVDCEEHNTWRWIQQWALRGMKQVRERLRKKPGGSREP